MNSEKSDQFIVTFFVMKSETARYYSRFTIYHSPFFVYTNRSLPEELLVKLLKSKRLRIFEQAYAGLAARQILRVEHDHETYVLPEFKAASIAV